MKKCPSCNKIFEDDNIFCVNDGSTLDPVFEVSQSRIVVSWKTDSPSSEIPTQVVPHPAPPANVPKNNPKHFYVIIGALVVIIVAMGGGFFVLRDTNKKETAQTSGQFQNSKSENNLVDSFSSNQNTAQPVNIPSKSEEKPKADSDLDNSSTINNWSGNSRPTNTNPAKDDFSLRRNFNQTFRGTADDDGISMQLQRSGSSLNGKVFSRKSITDISVSGEIYDDGSFEMNEYSDIGVMTGIYQGQISSNGTMTGTWTKPDGSKPRSIFLRTN